jgi:Sulfotransferase family
MWKALRPVHSLVAQMRIKGRKKTRRVEHRLLERPSREDVLHGFRLILGREPEDESAIDAHMLIPSVAELRQVLLSSDEFHGKYAVMHPGASDHPGLSVGRETLVFIHLQKTGGTSLRAMLEQQFAADRRCPVREDKLHLLTVAQLGRYDFFGGHFDRSAIRFIPRDAIKTVALFREPRARLISFYRFLRAHPVRDEFASDRLILIANESTAEEFFERPETRTFAAVYNHYLIALGRSFSWFDQNRGRLSKQDLSRALEEAKRQIRALTALGITERFDQSVEFIFRVLNLRPPASIEALHVTDNLLELDTRFQQVDPITMTPRLAAALEDLTVHDNELYRFAVHEFDRRCAELARRALPLSGA